MIPRPNDTVSNLHLFHSKSCGTPTSSISRSELFSNLVFSINCLYFFSPIFLAINTDPTFEDFTRISSTDRFFGYSFISQSSQCLK